ncbi:hypothetical protein KI387_019044 [Taxus chinensis]|uniref:Scarecrow-like protein 28 n=1 Tax=Taxus chinensis TaxID=29808 RepID=A0AA38G8Y4_TAXCH|nr:hypothetical protein KI387_019044 [Taxus chinensis]
MGLSLEGTKFFSKKVDREVETKKFLDDGENLEFVIVGIKVVLIPEPFAELSRMVVSLSGVNEDIWGPKEKRDIVIAQEDMRDSSQATTISFFMSLQAIKTKIDRAIKFCSKEGVMACMHSAEKIKCMKLLFTLWISFESNHTGVEGQNFMIASFCGRPNEILGKTTVRRADTVFQRPEFYWECVPSFMEDSATAAFNITRCPDRYLIQADQRLNARRKQIFCHLLKFSSLRFSLLTIADLQDIENSGGGFTNLQQPEALLPRTTIRSSFPFSSTARDKSITSDSAIKGQADVSTNAEPGKTNSSSCSEPPKFHINDDGNTSGNDSDCEGGSHNEFQNIMQPCSGGSAVSREQTQMEQGLLLVNLLIACTEAVASKNLHLVNNLLSRLGDFSSPQGSPMHRIAAYFTEGLIIRVNKLWPHIFQPIDLKVDLGGEDLMTGFQLLNHISPIPKFFHFTANEIILKAFEDKDRVHIIDFDVKQGLQWPSLFQSLASRPRPPSHVRITGIGGSKEDLQDTGVRLAGFAEALNLPFEFHAVVDKLEDVRLWMLHVKEKETLAVNCILQLHKTLYDNGTPLRDLLRLIRSTKVDVVTLVEQEASHNEATFERRLLQALQYYSAIFDSIDANLPLDSPGRLKVEQFFAREIRNIISCEGLERTERHEKFETWKQIMEEGGFIAVPLTEGENLQARMLLEMFSCKNYRLKQQDGGLTLCWLDQPLFTASAWALQRRDAALQ